jgi:dynein heavy chain, axonemal
MQKAIVHCQTKYLEPIMSYKRVHCQDVIRIHELNGIISFTRLFDTFWYENEFQQQLNDHESIMSTRLIDMCFVFCLIWSLAGNIDEHERKQIDVIFRELESTFPNKDTVFEFYIDINNQTWLHWEEQLLDTWTCNIEYKIDNTHIMVNLFYDRFE